MRNSAQIGTSVTSRAHFASEQILVPVMNPWTLPYFSSALDGSLHAWVYSSPSDTVHVPILSPHCPYSKCNYHPPPSLNPDIIYRRYSMPYYKIKRPTLASNCWSSSSHPCHRMPQHWCHTPSSAQGMQHLTVICPSFHYHLSSFASPQTHYLKSLANGNWTIYLLYCFPTMLHRQGAWCCVATRCSCLRLSSSSLTLQLLAL